MYVDLNGELEDILLNEPFVVDLLIQLAYASARSGQLQPFPDCLQGNDSNSVKDSADICQLLNRLPTVAHLAVLAAIPKGLQDGLKRIDSRLLPLLRWIVMSNTAHIKTLDRKEQMIAGLGIEWHQFKMTISTPQKEAIFQTHKQTHGGNNIFAFHGSPLSRAETTRHVPADYVRFREEKTGIQIEHAIHEQPSARALRTRNVATELIAGAGHARSRRMSERSQYAILLPESWSRVRLGVGNVSNQRRVS